MPTVYADDLVRRHDEHIRQMRRCTDLSVSDLEAANRMRIRERVEYASWFESRGIKLVFPSEYV